jgi:Na+/melibiose symporter-like transporter
MINYYAIGTDLGATYHGHAGFVASREGLMALGVLFAALVPALLLTQMDARTVYAATALVFIPILIICLLIMRGFSKNVTTLATPHEGFLPLFKNSAMRGVLLLFFLNTIPTSITSTLFLFYVADILKAESWAGAFLAIYFIAAAASMPVWLRLAARFGRKTSLFFAMALALFSFIWAYALGANDTLMFAVICLVSGFAVGGDLSLIPALFSETLEEEKLSSGSGFGVWNFIAKLNLAVAAGIALPVLGLLHYTPGNSNITALAALSFAYAILPCCFKIVAALVLMRLKLHDQSQS